MTPKLGLAGHKEDARGRTLKLRDFLRPELAVPHNSDNTDGMVYDSDPLANDVLGVCGIAAPGHFERWEDQLCKRPTVVDGEAVTAEYRNFGYIPGDPTSDNGVYALDVFKRWRRDGLFGRKIDAFAQVDYFDRDQTQAASFALGGTFLCLNLPKRVKAGSIYEADVWEVADDDGGPLGGHMVLLQGDSGNSWGKKIAIPHPFVLRYCFDAFAVVSRHGLREGRAFSGLDIDALTAALLYVTG